jgi:hypothetical protein
MGLFVSYTFENINEVLCNIYVVSGNEQQLKCKNTDLKKYQTHVTYAFSIYDRQWKSDPSRVPELNRENKKQLAYDLKCNYFRKTRVRQTLHKLVDCEKINETVECMRTLNISNV